MKFTKLRFFALVAGGALFLIGLLGFAFRTSTNIPDWHLLLNILLGFWGLLLVINNK